MTDREHDAPIRTDVVWPDPSPLSSWWSTVMATPVRGDHRSESTKTAAMASSPR